MNRSSFSRAVVDVLVLLLALPVFFKPELNPALTLTVGAFGGLVLCVTAALRGRRSVDRRVIVAFGASSLFVVWLIVAASSAADPLISFMGTLSQHSGAALWLATLAWGVAVVLLAERRTLRQLLAVTSVAGAVYAALGIIEAITSGDRGWGSAAGPFENSSSLGAFLIVSLLACGGWWLASRSAKARYAAAACGLVALAGFAAAESRLGLVGVATGGILTAFLLLRQNRHPLLQTLPVILPVAGIGTGGLLVAAATGSLGAAALRLVASLGTSRDAIWRSAAAQFAQAPVTGSGPEQFSAWVRWSFSQGMLQYNGTYDPHNLIAGIAVGSGIVGIVLFGVAGWALTAALLSVFERTGRPRVLAPVIAMPAALIGGALFAWLTPLATIAVAALIGAVLASAEAPLDASDGPAEQPSREDSAPPATRPVAGAMPRGIMIASLATAVLLLAPTIAGAPMLVAEWRYVRAGTSASPESLIGLYDVWPDPAFASLAVEQAFVSGADAAAVRRRLDVPSARVAEHVDLALRDIFLAQDALARGENAWPQFTAAIDAGVHADPASPIWYTVAAAQADGSGRAADRDRYAAAALALKPGAEERAYLEGLLAK